MRDVFKVLEQISKNSSRNTKKDILLANIDNEDLKKFLLYTYNERWIFGIGKKSIKSYATLQKLKEQKTAPQQGIQQRSLFGTPNVCKTSTIKAYNIFDICEELKQHPYGSNKDAQLVNDFLGNCTEEEYFWYSKLLLKDLKIGCSAKTINEIYVDLIPVYEVMLAFPIENHANKLVKKGAFQLQRKYNGFRFITYHHDNGSLQFFTRNGVELFNFPDIEEQFKNVKTYPGGMVYDGEVCTPSDKVNDAISIAMSEGPKTGLTYNIWDCLTYDEFEREKSFDKLFHRYDLLVSIMGLGAGPNILVVQELYRGTDLDEIDKWYDYAKARKWEGIMVKFDAEYVRKRTDDMLKVKGYETEDLVVIRLNEGESGGKNEGKMGSATVLYNGVEVNVGGGWSDYERDYYWKNPNELIDKTLEVRFFEQTSNKEGTHSLQHPRKISIRYDK